MKLLCQSLPTTTIVESSLDCTLATTTKRLRFSRLYWASNLLGVRIGYLGPVYKPVGLSNLGDMTLSSLE